jgi:hypothetical protein
VRWGHVRAGIPPKVLSLVKENVKNSENIYFKDVFE